MIYSQMGNKYHGLHHNWHEVGKEGANVDTKFFPCVSRPSAKDSAQDISSADVIWNATIAQCECQGANVVCNDTVCSVDSVHVRLTEFSLVWPHTSDFLDPGEDGGKNICVVIRAFVLDDRDQTLEAQSGVNVFRGKGFKSAVVFTIELDKHIVPYLQYVGVVLVDKVCSISPAYSVKMDLAI